jgi:hypothetical protein
MFGRTPNGAFAPLKGHGHALEAVAADFGERLTRAAHAQLLRWRASRLYGPTPNGGVGVQRNTGRTPEIVYGDYTAAAKRRITARFAAQASADRYAPVGNGAVRRLRASGERSHSATRTADARSQAKADDALQRGAEAGGVAQGHLGAEPMQLTRKAQAKDVALRELRKGLAGFETQREQVERELRYAKQGAAGPQAAAQDAVASVPAPEAPKAPQPLSTKRSA